MSQTRAQIISPVGILTASDINVSGVITASSFSGNLTGNATGLSGAPNLNVGVVTASSFFGDGAGLTGVGIGTTGNVNTTGIITASSFVGNLTGTATGLSGTPNVILGIATVSAGTTSAPSVTPTGDSNTGVFFPTADITSIVDGGSESLRTHAFGSIVYHNDVSIASSARNETSNTAFVIKNKNRGQVAIQAVWDGDNGYPTNADMVLYSNPYNATVGYSYRECMRLKGDGSIRIAGTTNCGLSTNSSISATGGLSLIGGNNTVAVARTDPSNTANNIFEIRNAVFGGDAILHFGSAAYTNYKCSIVARDVGNYGRMSVYFNSRNSGDGNPLVITTDTYFAYIDGSVYFPQTTTTASGANAFLNSGSSPVNQLLRSTSSLQYKTDVEDLDSSYSQKIYNLHPIWYRSLADADRKDWSWYGLAAEEVAKVEPRLVHYMYDEDQWETIETPNPTEEYPNQVKTEKVLKSDAVGKPDGVMYDRLTVLLLKELQNLKSIVDSQNEKINLLETEVMELKSKII